MIHAPDDRLLRVEDVAARLQLSVRQTWRLEAAGRLPAPIRLGRAVRWRQREVLAWLDAGSPDRDEWTARWEALVNNERRQARANTNGQVSPAQHVAASFAADASHGALGHLT